MQKDKFDHELRSIILKDEETFTPVFDKEKVWKNSNKTRRRNYILAIASAAACITLLLNLVFQREKEKVEIKTAVRTNNTYKTKNKPITTPVFTQKIQSSSKIKSEDLKKIILSVNEEASKDSELVESEDPNVIPAIPLVTNNTPPIDTPQLKVTFKRGKKVETVQELKITLRKGVKPSFELKTIPAPDTSAYYVNINPYNFKFKL